MGGGGVALSIDVSAKKTKHFWIIGGFFKWSIINKKSTLIHRTKINRHEEREPTREIMARVRGSFFRLLREIKHKFAPEIFDINRSPQCACHGFLHFQPFQRHLRLLINGYCARVKYMEMCRRCTPILSMRSRSSAVLSSFPEWKEF